MHPFFKFCAFTGVVTLCAYMIMREEKTTQQKLDDQIIITIKAMAETNENPINFIRALSDEGIARLSRISTAQFFNDTDYWRNVKLAICVETVLRTNNQEA